MGRNQLVVAITFKKMESSSIKLVMSGCKVQLRMGEKEGTREIRVISCVCVFLVCLFTTLQRIPLEGIYLKFYLWLTSSSAHNF